MRQALPREPASADAGQSHGPTACALVGSTPLVILLLAMVALRYRVASHMDFETDEAYYWLWSRRLAVSYFDHPPMIAYLIRLGTWLFGDTILGVRSTVFSSFDVWAFALFICAAVAMLRFKIGAVTTLIVSSAVGITLLWFNLTG